MSPVSLRLAFFAALFCHGGRLAALEVESLPPLPEAVSNNAVAGLEVDGQATLFSCMGLAAGKTHADVHQRAWAFSPVRKRWTDLPAVPGPGGRLAAVAAVADGSVWLFGGYTVGEDGSEVSTPQVFRRAVNGGWESAGQIPVPVDDATAYSYQGRFIYLVSGWHDLGNVNLVQVLDTNTMRWHMATPYPGAPVFGHAGAMSGEQLLVCDGVRIEYPPDGSSRRFLPSAECWLGAVNAGDFRRISWRPVPPHPGEPRYRMAAGADDSGRLVFAGGTQNPYNFNGVGYDGEPSEPEAMVFSFDLETLAWTEHGELPLASMDHRGLPFVGGWFYLLGGMHTDQQVTSSALRFRLDDASAE